MKSTVVTRHRFLRWWAATLAVLCLTGCGLSIPTDPDSTLDRARGGQLRVGVSPEPDLIDTSGSQPTGPLPDLVDEFSSTIDADPQWTVASEETLVSMLEDDQLDLVIGGFTDKTPWIDKAGMTRGYSEIPGSHGRKLVMLVPLGENAFLTELETFLDGELKE